MSFETYMDATTQRYCKMSELKAKLPVTAPPADGPYHDDYPINVTVSNFIHPRSIEPFYDVLEELSKNNATVHVHEADQDIGGPVGPKGWCGCDGAESHYKDKGDIYGLEELRIFIEWSSGEAALAYSDSDLKISPLLATLARLKDTNGKVECETINQTAKITTTTLVFPTQLSYKILEAYRSESKFSNWTITDFFNKEWENAEYVAHDPDHDAPGISSVQNTIGSLDTDLFEIVVVKDSTDTKIAEIVGDRVLLKQVSKNVHVPTGKISYHYSCTMQAIDLRANKDVLLAWIQRAASISSIRNLLMSPPMRCVEAY